MRDYIFQVADYAIHTKYLTLMEDLAFRRMLDLYYVREQPLPHDIAEIARLIGMREHVQEISNVLDQLFLYAENGYEVRNVGGSDA